MAKCLKTILMEVIMFITIATLVGHAVLHFWDFYVTRNEIKQMKNNLSSLKLTLFSIGNAYSNLYKDLNKLIKDSIPKKESDHNVLTENQATELCTKLPQNEDQLGHMNNVKKKPVTALPQVGELKGRKYCNCKVKSTKTPECYRKGDNNDGKCKNRDNTLF